MNAARTLDASAEAFLAIGDETTSAMCKRMAREARAADELMGIGDALYRHFASQLAERAAVKLEQYNRRAA